MGKPVRVGVWKSQSRIASKYALPTTFADASPILLASEASIEQVCEWAGIAADTRRFRPNIVVEGCAAFAEDSWNQIEIAGQRFEVLDTCVRCVLTTIDPDSGERHPRKEPMVSLMQHHANEQGQPLFGVNIRAIEPQSDTSVASGDEVFVGPVNA